MGKSNHRPGKKPVIFLAFANANVRDKRYLRNLPQEQREIHKALSDAVKWGLCEIVERSHATIEDIADVFQDEAYKDRAAVFHYGGHADSYQLFLETFAAGLSPAYREGLVSFLARQKGLKLVFLNGCATEQHALDLKQAGIPAVIGTSRVIDDKVAAQLAIRFYKAVANGLCLERAWRESEDYIKMQVGAANFGAMYHWEQQENHPDRFPWDIYFKEGAEEAKQWNLPDAVNDPLFGLPTIPQTCPLPGKPFLFLDRYQRKHAEIFFGRSHYTRQLYDRITDEKSSPIILLYGQSGVGKSSLLEAGLMPRLEESHTLVYVRRDREKGLSATLEEALRNRLLSLKKDVKNQNLEKIWKHIEVKTRKPLVIILDQVDEAFTHNNKNVQNELEDFTAALKNLFGKPAMYPQGKLVLSYRKEYHPEINKQLQVNELDGVPVFLQPLNREDIGEVVTGLTRSKRLQDKYHLELEEGLPMIIADELLEDRSSPIAPTLQIVMTKMWDNSEKEEFSPVHHFTVEQFQALKRQGLLMEDFFKQQMEKLRNRDKGVVDSGLALDVLKFHTTPLATACPRNIEEIKQIYPHSRDIIESLVQHLKDLYLLTDTRYGKKQTSLVHDTLAPIVINASNESDKPGQRASRILAARIEDFKKNPGDVWLNEADLQIVEEGKGGMKILDDEEKKLLGKSRERKMERQMEIRRYKRIRLVSVIFIVLFAVFAAWQWREAVDRARIIKANYLVSQEQLRVEDDPTEALAMAQKARDLDENNITNEAIHSVYRENNFYKIIARPEKDITSVTFSGDGRYIIADFSDKTIRVWNLQGKELKDFRTNKVEIARSQSPPNRGLVIIGSPDGTVHLMNKEGVILRDFKGHEGRLSAHTFSSDGRYVLTGSYDKTARLWDLQGNQLEVFRGHRSAVTSVAISPDDGRYILTATADNTLRIWELKDKELETFVGHRDRVSSAAFSPDGRHVLTGSNDGTLRLWDIKGKPLQVFSNNGIAVTSLSFSPVGKHFLSGSENGIVRLWNEYGKILWTLEGHKAAVVSSIFSPDGKYILTASHDKTARLWVFEGKEIRLFKGHTHRLTSAVFSPDGQYILTGSYDKTIRLWDLSGNELLVINGHKKWITSVSFSPGGRYILSGSFDGTARMWDLKGKELMVFKGHTDVVHDVAFSPDGKYILTCSSDNTTRLWDLKGNQLQILRGHKDIVLSAAFSPDGRYVLSGSFDRTARLWKICTVDDYLLDWGCQLPLK